MTTWNQGETDLRTRLEHDDFPEAGVIVLTPEAFLAFVREGEEDA